MKSWDCEVWKMSTSVLELERSSGISAGLPLAGFPLNSAPPDFASALPEGFLEFLLPLHEAFTPRQQDLVAARARVLAASHLGQRPDHLRPSEATTIEWKIALPSWCADQRNQMTGPADDAELV